MGQNFTGEKTVVWERAQECRKAELFSARRESELASGCSKKVETRRDPRTRLHLGGSLRGVEPNRQDLCSREASRARGHSIKR